MPMLPAALLSKSGYAPGQMTYDLRRLRLAGLIRRLDQTHRYVLTPDGIKVAVFYADLHNRLLRLLLATAQPPVPAERRDATRHRPARRRLT
jgi:predicted MarR family transcription regulator